MAWVPTKCLSEHRWKHSVEFGGKFINLTAVARETGLSHGYVSRALAGKRGLGLKNAEKLSVALGMSIEALSAAIATRKTLLDSQKRPPSLPPLTEGW